MKHAVLFICLFPALFPGRLKAATHLSVLIRSVPLETGGAPLSAQAAWPGSPLGGSPSTTSVPWEQIPGAAGRRTCFHADARPRAAFLIQQVRAARGRAFLTTYLMGLMPLLVVGQVLRSAAPETPTLRSLFWKCELDSVAMLQGQLGLFQVLFPTHRAAGSLSLVPTFPNASCAGTF